MAKPGLVLRRPIGTNAAFSEHAALPTHLGSGATGRAPPRHRTKLHEPPSPTDDRTARGAALAFDRQHKSRERQTFRDEAARKKKRERRDLAITVAESALEEGRQMHKSNLANIEKARQALDRRKEAQEARWRKQKEQLESALRHARSPGHPGLLQPATLATNPFWRGPTGRPRQEPEPNDREPLP